MITSMTGFGRAKFENEYYQLTTEIKTVNHRFLEMNIRMPKHLMVHEDKIRKIMQAALNRGRVEISITIDGQGIGQKKLHVDWLLMEQYVQTIEKTKVTFGLSQEIVAQDLLLLPDVFSLVEVEREDEHFLSYLLQTVEDALTRVKEMREIEGAQLCKDVLTRIAYIEQSIEDIQVYAPKVAVNYKERLHMKLQEMKLNNYDEQRMLTEVTLIADRCDINEELIRMNSHLTQFKETLHVNEPIGRKLEFILQEMNREVNTIGSKANDLSISRHTIEMKNNLEKIREQVQNIE